MDLNDFRIMWWTNFLIRSILSLSLSRSLCIYRSLSVFALDAYSRLLRSRIRCRTRMGWTSTKNEGNRTPVNTFYFNQYSTLSSLKFYLFNGKRSFETHANWVIIFMIIFSLCASFRYPSRYGLYLKDKPNTVVVPLEYEPEDKPIRSGKD